MLETYPVKQASKQPLKVFFASEVVFSLMRLFLKNAFKDSLGTSLITIATEIKVKLIPPKYFVAFAFVWILSEKN